MAGGAATREAAFGAVFERLKAILEPYGWRLHVVVDEPSGYSIDMAAEAERNPTTWFAGVRVGRAYVSYYLMPVYVEPSLLDGVSPELRRRMQGKSCFNFTKVDEGLLAELEALTARGFTATAGDPRWGVAKREEHDMAYRSAMSEQRSGRRSGRRAADRAAGRAAGRAAAT